MCQCPLRYEREGPPCPRGPWQRGNVFQGSSPITAPHELPTHGCSRREGDSEVHRVCEAHKLGVVIAMMATLSHLQRFHTARKEILHLPHRRDHVSGALHLTQQTPSHEGVRQLPGGPSIAVVLGDPLRPDRCQRLPTELRGCDAFHVARSHEMTRRVA